MTLGVLDEWFQDNVPRIDLLDVLIRRCHQAIALERPMFALDVCQLAAAVNSGAAERIENAFVANAMPNQWSRAPGEVPPAFINVQKRARQIHETFAALSASQPFHTIATEAIRRGRANAVPSSRRP